ncbi:MAG TPA: hypothetical protein PLU75_04605 [Oscillospiraceae bacterium]|nr:hypothetical protein [Oscillospiraceae bacterium]HRW57247.1 hypothetical protein [Oscillospiraceae bacterium]
MEKMPGMRSAGKAPQEHLSRRETLFQPPETHAGLPDKNTAVFPGQETVKNPPHSRVKEKKPRRAGTILFLLPSGPCPAAQMLGISTPGIITKEKSPGRRGFYVNY